MSDIQATTETTTTAPPATDGAATDGGKPTDDAQETKTEETKSEKTSILGDAGKDADQNTSEGKPTQEESGELKITLPEGMKADEKDIEAFAGIAKDVGLNSEQASKMAASWVTRLNETVETQVKEWEAQDKAWEKELKEDPDFGGKQFDATVLAAQKAVKAYGGVAVSALLNEQGLGNHPELVRFMARIGRAMGEDNSQFDGSGGSPTVKTADQLKRDMYPTMFDESGNPAT